MIFRERPITARQIHEVCERFHEGVRVEYKSALDASVKDKLPKIVSSFANSQGGALVIGVRTANGVAQPPFDGFPLQAREELPVTVENICLSNIHPPIVPRTELVQSDVPGHAFLVIEVEESSEAPHAIENSKLVYVRTGNASNPFDLADVDLIIDLMKRRHEPVERRKRLLALAEGRSLKVVPPEQLTRPFCRVSISPNFPRRPLCAPQEVWDFLSRSLLNGEYPELPESIRRIPDGVASLKNGNPPRVQGHYLEIASYGLLFAATELAIIPWGHNVNQESQLCFANIFQTLLAVTTCADHFYDTHGYRGNIAMSISVHHAHGRPMRFVGNPGPFPDNPEDFRCCTDVVSAERLLTTDRMRLDKVNVLTDILGDVTWAFWQSNKPLPVDRLRQSVAQAIQTGPT